MNEALVSGRAATSAGPGGGQSRTTRRDPLGAAAVGRSNAFVAEPVAASPAAHIDAAEAAGLEVPGVIQRSDSLIGPDASRSWCCRCWPPGHAAGSSWRHSSGRPIQVLIGDVTVLLPLAFAAWAIQQKRSP